MSDQRYPLHAFVTRVLWQRLLLVALGVSLVIGAASWFQMRNQAETKAVVVALDRLAVIRSHFQVLRHQGLPVEEAVEEAVASVAAMDFDRSGGKFIYGFFYDLEGDFFVFQDTDKPEHAAAESMIGTDSSARPDLGDQVSSVVKVDGKAAIRVAVPIPGHDGRLAAWFSGIYLLSPAGATVLWREPLTAVAYVILVVLITSSLFFPIVHRMARRLARFSADLLESNLEMMEALGCAIAKRDGDTDAHNYRVTIYSVRLAEKEGLSDKAIQGLIKGAFLHDIGKIGIRDNVLLKPGKLTDEEYEVMKSHVQHGLDIVGRSRWLKDALAIVGYHHEKFGGGGYPESVPGEMIPTTARIFAIADVFDALSSERPYKDALPLKKVTAILEEGRGHHFDPVLLDSFLAIVPKLHEQLVQSSMGDLQEEMLRINGRYFASGLEALPA